jgi:hypothetical protein
MFLFRKIKEKYESEIIELNFNISTCKDSIKRSELQVQSLETKLFELAKEYNVEVYKTGNLYNYKIK